MPCNTIQRSKVEFLATSTDLSMLAEAFRSLEYRYVNVQGSLVTFRTLQGAGSFEKSTGRLTLPESCDVDTIKRAYSEQVVQSQARKHGWKIAWTTNPQGRREAVVQRRA